MALLFRVLVRTTAEPAMRRALPVYAGVGIFAAVLLGPTGLSPHTITGAARTSIGFGAGLWLLWLALIAPAVRAAFRAPGTTYLRALPIAPLLWWAWLAGLSVVLQLPWIALWWSGEGAGAAMGAAFAAAALAILCGLRPRGIGEGALELLIAGAIMALVLAQPPILWLASSVVLAGAVLLGWARAPEQPVGRALVGQSGGGGGLRALWRCHLAMLGRERRAAWSRGIALGLCGGGLAGLFARSNQLQGSGLAQLVLAVGCVTLAIVAGVVAAPVLESERRARWLLDSCGVTGGQRVSAGSLAVAAALLVPGILHGATAALIARAGGADAARGIASALALAIAFGVVALSLARRSERSDGIDGSRLVSLMAVVAVLALVAVGWIGELALVAVAAAAILAVGTSVELSLVPHRRWRRSERC